MNWAEKCYEKCKNNPPPKEWEWIDDNGESITYFSKDIIWALSIVLVTEGWWHWSVFKKSYGKENENWNPVIDQNARTVAKGSAATIEDAKKQAEIACANNYQIELNARKIQLEKAKRKNNT